MDRSSPARFALRPALRARGLWLGLALLAPVAGARPQTPASGPPASIPQPTSASGSVAPDPFAPAERWAHAADPAAPWVPTSVAFGARGELVLALAGYGTPGLQLHAAGAGSLPLLHAAPLPSGTLGSGSSVLADPAGALALTLTQQPATDPGALPGTKTTRLDAYDAELAAAGAPLAPRWTHTASFATTAAGWAAVAPRDDSLGAPPARVVLALRDDLTGLVHVEVLDLATGASLGTAAVPGGLLRGLDVARDAERIALSAGDQLIVLDAAGASVHVETLASVTQALALSADGARLVVGAPGALRVLEEGPGGYSTAATIHAVASESAVRAAISADGSTLAVAWWNHSTGTSLRFEQWSADGVVRHHAVQLGGPSGSPQVWPTAVALSKDGQRALFTTWGAGDAGPELLLYDRDESAPRLSVDTGGSVLAAALGPDGTRVAAAVKSTHAGVFATTGEVRLFDTGERDLQVIGAATLGGVLRVAHREEGNLHSLFLLGAPAGAGLVVPGVAGELWLSPAGAVWFSAPADASGRADLVLPLPGAPALAGLQVGFQALGLTASGAAWSEVVARPWLGF